MDRKVKLPVTRVWPQWGFSAKRKLLCTIEHRAGKQVWCFPTTDGNTTNNDQQQRGKIDKILHNDEKGADRFIKYDNNKSIYFRLQATGELIKSLNIGFEVTFKILPPKEDGKRKGQ